MISKPSNEGKVHLHYRELAERLPNSLLFILDRDLRVVFAGGSLLARLRWQRDAIAGMPLAGMVPPAVYAQAEPHLRATLAGQEHSYELSYPTGETFDVRAAPLPGDDGSTQHVLVVALDITAHRRAEKSERVLEKRLHLALQAANVGLWDWDLVTNRVYHSREWKRQLGYNEDEIGDDFGEWEQRVHPEDVAQAHATACRFVAAPWPNFAQEFRMRHKDGSYRWILTRAALLYDENGRAIHMLGAHSDITEKKRAELALAEAEQIARATLDGLAAHIAIVAADGTVVAVNRAWRQFAAANPPGNAAAANRAPDVCEGANYAAVCRAAAAGGCPDAQQWLDGMEAVLAGKTESAEFEYACHSPREQRWFLVRISRLPRGGPPQLVVAHENITGRKRSDLEREELLHQLQGKADQLAQVMHSVPEGVLLLDNHGCVLLANPRAEQLLAFLGEYGAEQRLVRLGGMALASFLTAPPTGQWHTLQVGQRYYEIIAHTLESGPVPGGWVLVLHDATIEHAVQEQTIHYLEQFISVS